MYCIMYAYLYKGDVDFTLGNLRDALENLKTAMQIGVENNYIDLLMITYNLMAIVYVTQLDELMAVDYYFKSMDLAIKCCDYNYQGMIYSNLASLYMDYDKVEDAFVFIQKGRALRNNAYENNEKDISDRSVDIKENVNTAKVYYKMGDYNKALSYVDENVMSNEAIQEDKCWFAIGAIRAKIYMKLGNRDKVIESCERAFMCDEVEYDQIECFNDLIDFAKIYIELGMLEKAEKVLESILAMCEKEPVNKYWIEYYEVLMEYAKNSNDDELLFKAYEKYYEFKSLIIEESKKLNIEAIDNRIELLNEKQKNVIIKDKNKELEIISKNDELTKLPNRYALNEYMDLCIERAISDNHRLGVLVMDIDHFKNYNDEFGHLQGDECLKKVASAIDSVVNNQGMAARFGGDEFVVVLYEKNREEIIEIGNDILKKIREKKMPFIGNNKKGIVSITIGGACFELEHNITREELLKRADEALYTAKKNGRDRIVLAE